MIDTEALRSKILDLAIRGKLTEQLPEDGSAEDLYAKIQEEKARLVKEGKLKREKALPEITEAEIPFEIPENWKWVRLIDFSSVINGDRGKNYPAKSTLSKRGIPFISALNLNGYGVDADENLLCLNEEQYNKLGSGKLQKGDVVICIRGSLGKHGKYPYEKGAIASSLVIARPIYTQGLEESGNYMMIWLDSTLFFKEIDKYDGGSAQPNLSAENLKKFLLPLPPFEEQKRIIDKVNDILERIDKIEYLQLQYASNVQVLKDKFIAAGIRGKLTEQLPEDGNAEDLYNQIQYEKARLIKEGKIKKEKPLPDISKDEIPFEIPKSWKWVRIGKVINEVIVPQRDKPLFSGDIPWCRIEDRDGIYLNGTKSGQYVSEQTVKAMNLRIFPVGTVLSACSGASIGTILINTVECCTNQTFNGLVCNDLFYNWYLFWFLKSEISRLKSMGSGSAMAYISQDKIRNMLIPLPPFNEQKRIVESLETMMKLL